MTDVRLEVTQRLKALELIALWEGRLVTNHLCDWYGISRQQASADIKHYLAEHNPDALSYNATLKGYEPASSFRPVLSSGHINDYLLLLSSHGSEPMAQILESHPNIAAVQLPDRAVQPAVVRNLLLACRNGHSLQIGYASMSQPEPHQRVISPHSLVYTGYRWHARAWCHQREAFRDFVLSRIMGTPVPADLPAPDKSADNRWQTQTAFRLIANTMLSPAQRTVIERDFGMDNGHLLLTCRQALVHYTLQRYPAAVTTSEAEQAIRYPLTIHPEDQDSITPLLFNQGGN